MKTIIVSRTTAHEGFPVPVYQIRYHDNGTVEAFWYGADGALLPFSPQPTPDEAAVYIRRARNAPDGQLTTISD